VQNVWLIFFFQNSLKRSQDLDEPRADLRLGQRRPPQIREQIAVFRVLHVYVDLVTALVHAVHLR